MYGKQVPVAADTRSNVSARPVSRGSVDWFLCTPWCHKNVRGHVISVHMLPLHSPTAAALECYHNTGGETGLELAEVIAIRGG
jgi:hypothetical protein